ncbi:PmoA family protein [Paenibacillus sp. GCM10023252]|uniref:DUF6807 domain-containing protein n=1 Tax=Paenibacillus sp. GCM10023252 TaxID=3252649 RepID=UPI003619CC80
MTDLLMSYPKLNAIVDGNRLHIYRKDNPIPIVTQQADFHHRPFLHPIVAPDGIGVLTEDKPAHHPWQHGLYIGLNDVNGIGFWCEGLIPKRAAADGTFHPAPLKKPVTRDHEVSWSVETAYRNPGGAVMIHETQHWELTDYGESYNLDLNWTLEAATDITFGHYDYGGVFLRMAYRQEAGGTVLNSEGQRGLDAEGQRARWTAVAMPVEGRFDEAGIAVLDHPHNLEHPVPWRVDSELGIGPSSCRAGAWTLKEGQARTFSYRFHVFTGDIQVPNIEQQWTLLSRRNLL